ncbi:hypothetical protein HNY73_013889 [Argiope bruennichi]|uniref:SEA domain-containing protein n=1 Tax=Argiope bruennichi TaxID=94029 RepID=A0A8T0EMJ8_ARGBR|nr:hypothetical protein HNY73_013889 [Argiope bruennichi]
MLIFIIGGIVLFVSGESTVPPTAEEKTPNSVTPLILSTTENRSSEISSSSVASNAEEEPEKVASTASNIELDEASKTSEPINGNKTHSIVNSEVLSTEVLTTLLSTDPTSEDSEHASSTEKYHDRKEITSTSKVNLISDDKEYETRIDLHDAEDASDKSLLSPSNEISETSTNIVSTTNEIHYKKDSFSTMSNEEISHQTEESMSPSSMTAFTSASSPADDALVEGSTPVKTFEGKTTEVRNTEEYSEKQSPNHVDNVHLSEEKTAGSTLAVSESTIYLETETVQMIDNTGRMTSEDQSTENSLSLHKTTPKSATKKRSLNNTGDTILHRETTAASDSFSSSFGPELTTLLEHGESVSGSIDGLIILPKSNTSKKESNMQNENENSAETLSPIAAPSISSGFGSIGNVEEKGEKFVMPHSNPEKSNENYSTLSVKEQDNLSDKKTPDFKMETASVNPTLHSEASVMIPKASDDYSHLNNLDNVGHTFSGVTFDPDGMKNSEPQDPDSVVFFVPSTNFDKMSTPENTYPSTTFTAYGSSESEREFEFVTHKNLNEGSDSGNGTGESEKMEHIPLDKNINIPPLPPHYPEDSSEILTFETANNSNSSSNFVFWDPSNGGWILPKTTTDTQIKRIDTALNDESEEMLQDAPQFFDADHAQNKSPSSNLKIDPKEKDEIKTTIGHRTSSFSKELETETVTEAGFIGFSNSFVPHQTDQSVIRPVKIKLTSPDDKSVSTSVLPGSFSTLAPEQPPGLKLSEPVAGTTIEKIETSSMNTSSPNILPDSTPSVITEIIKNPELSTIVIQPELVPFSLDKKSPANTTSAANSTIAGIAVKTSVSVSLPLSKSKNDSQALQPMIEELMKKMNSTSLLVNGSSISVKPETSEPSTPTPSDTSTDGLTITSDQTTTATGFKIRKPKIKIPGTDSGPNTPRPYRPFTPGLKKPTTTAGPPISIFRKQKTRIASITSSTTARPYRPFNGNFATVKIQFASDIPGLLPQEFLISTQPVTTTTTEPTTTEEPISEVPFTDQTHIPTVANEDDVTLVKVAGYVAIDRGLRWNDLLHNRHSPEYKKDAEAMHLYLERMFRSSPIASRLWKIEIDGFSGNKKTRPVGVDFFLYLIKTRENIPTEHLATVFHGKLSANNTFGTFRVDPSKTAFEMIQEEPLKPPTPPPEEENVEPPIPQWAIAVIVIGAASLIFIVLFAAVTIYGRHHMRRRYSSKLNEEDMERSSGEWESKMAAAYENMAADTIYDAEDLHSDSYKKNNRIATFHGIPSTLKRCDSWSSNGWTTPPKRKRPHVH